MATKNHPGKFDCYAKAEPDEPMFVLLGRDPYAAMTVLFWIALRAHIKGGDALTDDKSREARECVAAMGEWGGNLETRSRAHREWPKALTSVPVDGQIVVMVLTHEEADLLVNGAVGDSVRAKAHELMRRVYR